MKRFLIIILSVLVLGIPAFAKERKFRKTDKRIPDQYIVLFAEDVDEAEVEALSDDLSRRHGGLREYVYTSAVKGFSVKMRGVRVLNCSGSGSWSQIIAGIDWVRANHIKPAVANMSLGGGANSSVDTAVNNLINAGVTVVVAAGNSNANACNYSPARVSAAITVGSTTSSDGRSSFSNYGSCLDIFAPGSSITSAWYTSNTATNTISGTSMASPHVAGVAALYLQGSTSASPATVRNALVNNANTNVVGNAGTGSPNRLLFTSY